MKKPILLLMTLLFVLGVNAQIRFDREDAKIGYSVENLTEDGSEQALRVTFNIDGVSVNSNAASSNRVRSIGGFAYDNEGARTTFIGNTCRFQTRNANVAALYFNNIGQLIERYPIVPEHGQVDEDGNPVLNDEGEQVIVPTDWGHLKHANIILDVPGEENEQALGLWPGEGVGSVISLFFGFEKKSVLSDISFDLLTLDPGTVNGAQTKVKAILYLNGGTDYVQNPDIDLFSRLTSENAAELGGGNFYVVDDIYTSVLSGAGRESFRVAEAFGLSTGIFSNNNRVNLFLFMPNAGPSNNTQYYPIVGVDNLYVETGNAKWIEPVVDLEENYYHPVDTIEVYPGIPAEYKMVLKDQGRLGKLTIDTDNEIVNIYSVKSVLANDGEGNYTQEIEGIEIENNEGVYNITIPAPSVGSVDDDIEITLLVDVPRGATVGGRRTYRMEVDNGVRFWLDFTANIVAAPVAWVEPAVEEGETDATGFELPLGNHKTPVTFKLIDNSRWADLVISTDNEEEVAGFYFEEEGAIKSGDSSVDYDFVYDEASASYTLTVAYTEGELVDDDLEVTMYASLDSDDTSLIGEKITYRLAVNNGILIYKELVATVVADPTGITDQTVSNIRLTASSRTITVENAEEDVMIINTTGQIVKSVPAAEAAKGIAVENGVYIVKSGAYVQKALVK